MSVICLQKRHRFKHHLQCVNVSHNINNQFQANIQSSFIKQVGRPHKDSTKKRCLVCASMLKHGHTFFYSVCTFEQLIFVKEDPPQPGSCSPTGNCMKMFSSYSLALLDPKNRFTFNHRTALDKHFTGNLCLRQFLSLYMTC